MSIQWTVVAGFLYMEIGIVIMLVIPTTSPRKWKQLFNSRNFTLFRDQATVYFYILMGILVLFLFDAINDIRKYSHPSDSGTKNVASEMAGSVKLFRSQRNFYITGFAIFLAFVIRRLVSMILVQADLVEESESIVKEAAKARDIAKMTVIAERGKGADDEREYKDMKYQILCNEQLLRKLEHRNKELESELKLLKKNDTPPEH